MAEHLASILGTEKDKVNCPFYFKIGACIHGDRCSRLHTKPSISPTLLFSNMYQRPDMITPASTPKATLSILEKSRSISRHSMKISLRSYPNMEIFESLNICDNLADHMIGNVYVQFSEEEHAAKAISNMTERLYAGRPIIVDFSPVTDFSEATCRQYEEKRCNRGGYCNFMHLKRINTELRRRLYGTLSSRYRRSRSRNRHKSHEYYGSRGHSKRYDDREEYYESRSRRHKSSSNSQRRGRSRSPFRDGKEERHAIIEKWNREKEQAEQAKSYTENAEVNHNG